MKEKAKILFCIFCLSFLFLSIFPKTSFSQNDIPKVDHISLEDGVSNNLIFSIYQDSRGFIWFGTMFGLVKYDGVNYTTYRHDPLDTNSLSNDDIISIAEDKNGNLWLGTYNGGLNKYDRLTGKFTRFLYSRDNANSVSSNTVWQIIQDREGAMWFATEGGGLSKLENNNFTTYKKDTLNKESISGNYIRTVAEDKDGNIWAGTIATGLNKFDRKSNVFTNYRNDPVNEKSVGNNQVTAIFEDSEGDLWIGTGGGLNKFEKKSGDFKKYKNDSSDVNSISNDFILSIAEDTPGHLLIGTQKGLNKFDKAAGSFERIKIYDFPNNKKEVVLRFIKDKSGVIWASLYLDGLIRLYYPPDKFRSILDGKNAKSIYEDKEGRLWVGTANDGLQMSADEGKNFTAYINDKKNAGSISSNSINSVTEDIYGTLWIGTKNGLNKLVKGSAEFIKYFYDEKNESGPGSNNILKVYADREGTLWTGTDNGLDKFIPGSNSFVHYRNSVADTNSLSENSILSIYEDRSGELWVGTYSGLNVLDRNSEKFKHYRQKPDDPKSISNNYVFSFCEDNNNNFWIGTGGGLNIMDKKNGTFFNFTERDGLPNEVIAGLESSTDGYLWISTFKGISRFDIKNKVFKNYDSEDGLLSNMFNAGSYYKGKNGEIIFGGINGVNIINPAGIKESKYVPDIVFTSLVKYNGNDKHEIDISGMNDIELSYDDSYIKIGFTSTDFTNPKKNKFSYMLEGFDRKWNYSGNADNAVYTNLNPGNYVFKVMGTNSDGVWNEKESSLKITITPPFWKTWWFYGGIIILLTALIILIQNYRVKLRVKNLIELEKIKERERELMREQASRDYHDELGHKLTRISMYSRRINKKLRPSANGLTNDLNSIVETSNSLQSGAKDLIWAMNPHEDSLYDFAVRLRDFGNELFENTGINFSVNGISEEFRNLILSMNSKRHLIYIFKEGMNNILKYSRCSNVRLMFSFYDDDLEIALEDNGIGFDMDSCPKGYGLKNIFSRAAQININVNISSGEHTGTKIILKAKTQNLIANTE